MTKLLPIEKKPFIQTYGDHASELSILSQNKYFDAWFYTNYMFLSFWQCPLEEHPIYFDYDLLTRCKLLDYYVFHAKGYHKIDNILEYIKDKINHDTYCVVAINERYVPTTSAYQRYDFYHRNFFYGYSDEEQSFYIMTHNKDRHYCEATLSYHELISGYDSMEAYWPVITMRLNQETYDVDWGKIANDYQKYRSDIFFAREGLPCVSGIHVSLAVIEALKNDNTGNLRQDPRVFETIKEHKYVLLQKARFFMKEGVPDIDHEIIEKYETIYESARTCEMLFLKYMLTQKSQYLERIYEKLYFIYNTEKILVPKTAVALKKHLKNINWNKPVGFNDIQNWIHCGTQDEDKVLFQIPHPEKCSISKLEKWEGWNEIQRNIWEDGQLIYCFDLPKNVNQFSVYARVWGSVRAYLSNDRFNWQLVFEDRLAGPADNIKLSGRGISKFSVDGDAVYLKLETDDMLAMTDLTYSYSVK